MSGEIATSTLAAKVTRTAVVATVTRAVTARDAADAGAAVAYLAGGATKSAAGSSSWAALFVIDAALIRRTANVAADLRACAANAIHTSLG